MSTTPKLLLHFHCEPVRTPPSASQPLARTPFVRLSAWSIAEERRAASGPSADALARLYRELDEPGRSRAPLPKDWHVCDTFTAGSGYEVPELARADATGVAGRLNGMTFAILLASACPLDDEPAPTWISRSDIPHLVGWRGLRLNNPKEVVGTNLARAGLAGELDSEVLEWRREGRGGLFSYRLASGVSFAVTPQVNLTAIRDWVRGIGKADEASESLLAAEETSLVLSLEGLRDEFHLYDLLRDKRQVQATTMAIRRDLQMHPERRTRTFVAATNLINGGWRDHPVEAGIAGTILSTNFLSWDPTQTTIRSLVATAAQMMKEPAISIAALEPLQFALAAKGHQPTHRKFLERVVADADWRRLDVERIVSYYGGAPTALLKAAERHVDDPIRTGSLAANDVARLLALATEAEVTENATHRRLLAGLVARSAMRLETSHEDRLFQHVKAESRRLGVG